MKLGTEPWTLQQERWPRSGRHILAQFDDAGVVIYQAYRPGIGRFAAENGYFGGEFSLARMSWVKPNFLWMMYRSGWGTKPDQEVTLAVRLRREAFDAILEAAVPSSFQPEVHPHRDDWGHAIKSSSVRLQWDPDHVPSGEPVERRAIQLGLRGDFLKRYAREWAISIEDISDFVAEQRKHVEAREYSRLRTPREKVYPVRNPATAARIGLHAVLKPAAQEGWSG